MPAAGDGDGELAAAAEPSGLATARNKAIKHSVVKVFIVPPVGGRWGTRWGSAWWWRDALTRRRYNYKHPQPPALADMYLGVVA